MLSCPICRKDHSSFVPLSGRWLDGVVIEGKHHSIHSYETLNVKDYACPTCGASDRARLYYLFLEDQIEKMFEDKKSPLNILHLAPEDGLFRRYLQSHKKINYRTADLFRSDVDDQVDITDMKRYKNGQFDIVLCSHILEHVYDEASAIREIARVLTDSGLALLMVPILLTLDKNHEDPSITSAEERWKAFGQDDHVRVHSKAGFRHLIEEVGGFKLFELGTQHFSESLFKKHGLTPTSTLYIAKKTSA